VLSQCGVEKSCHGCQAVLGCVHAQCRSCTATTLCPGWELQAGHAAPPCTAPGRSGCRQARHPLSTCLQRLRVHTRGTQSVLQPRTERARRCEHHATHPQPTPLSPRTCEHARGQGAPGREAQPVADDDQAAGQQAHTETHTHTHTRRPAQAVRGRSRGSCRKHTTPETDAQHTARQHALSCCVLCAPLVQGLELLFHLVPHEHVVLGLLAGGSNEARDALHHRPRLGARCCVVVCVRERGEMCCVHACAAARLAAGGV
jgi:hypothetical protein